MNGLYLLNTPSPFTRLIRVTPQQSVNRITNRTLDGKEHVQIIGSPVRTLVIEAQVDRPGRLTLENLSATGLLFTIKDDPDTYTGRITDLGQFTKPIRGHYRTTITVAVEAVT